MSSRGYLSFNGTDLIVIIFSVTSSPTKPFPRVDPVLKIPFSYSSDTDKPSILGSTTNTGESSCSLHLFIKASTSSNEKTS